MKPSVLSLAAALAASAHARCTARCAPGTCLQAIAGNPLGAEPFCSSWLSLSPATSVVVDVETVTSSAVRVETETVVVTDLSTLTTVIPTVTIYERALPQTVNIEASILAECVNLEARVSSACSCVVSNPSTVTVRQASTVVLSPEYTSTETITLTTDGVAMATSTPIQTIPAQPILNSEFDQGMAASPPNILPWLSTTATTGGTVEAVNVASCISSGCTGGTGAVRVTPPRTGMYDYTSISEEFVARSSTTYSLSFYFRCLNYDAAASIDVYYNGVVVARKPCTGTPTGAVFANPTGMLFTTDQTGRGMIEIRFTNPSQLPYLYMYADAFRAVAV